MSNIVQRNAQKSLAKTVEKLSKELQLPTTDIVTALNERYGYVSEHPKEVNVLTKQVELDMQAEAHARRHKLKVKTTAVLATAADRELGNLTADMRDQLNGHETGGTQTS
ncbi:hypothetical protein AB0656_002575 [Vibrio parahaemolyticus]